MSCFFRKKKDNVMFNCLLTSFFPTSSCYTSPVEGKKIKRNLTAAGKDDEQRIPPLAHAYSPHTIAIGSQSLKQAHHLIPALSPFAASSRLVQRGLM
jgi:hypothetical protein